MNIIGQTKTGIPIELYRRGKGYQWTKSEWEKLTYESRETSTYKPLTHIHVLNMLIGVLESHNQVISKIRVNLGGGLKVCMVARILTGSPDESDTMKNMWTVVHGHNRQSSIHVASGFEVVACTNGLFYANDVLSGMHTKNVVETFTERLNDFVVADLADHQNRLDLNEKLKDTLITLPFANHLIMEAAIAGYIKRPVRVATTFINDGDYSVWGLWQAITYNEEICGAKPLQRSDEQLALLRSLIT